MHFTLMWFSLHLIIHNSFKLMRVLNWQSPLHLMTNFLQPELMFSEEKSILKTGFKLCFFPYDFLIRAKPYSAEKVRQLRKTSMTQKNSAHNRRCLFIFEVWRHFATKYDTEFPVSCFLILCITLS